MADTAPIYPAFFRIFLSEYHSEKMKVPPEFLKYLEEDISGNVILIGSSGYQWQVTTSKEEKVYMQNGWPQVLADNSVKTQELLLFTYNGQNRFLVQFFSGNGCERQCTKAPTPKLARTRKRGRERKEQKYPDFFKVFLPEQHSERMLIPNAFVRLARQQGWEPRNLILKNLHGKVWEVKALPINNKLYFDDGWKQFREDNCLKAVDFVFFTHVVSNVFNFKICESTGCEKTKVNDSGEQEEEMDDVIQLDEEEEEEEEEEEDDYNNDDDYYYDEEFKATMRRQSTGKACKINLIREKEGSSVTKAEDHAEHNEIDVEMYTQPENPGFIHKPWKNRNNILQIPHTIIKDFSIRSGKKVTIVCCRCQNIPRNQLQNYHLSLHHRRHTERGVVTKWKDGRVCIKGWAAFCRKNNIKENDTCICEIVWQELQDIEMIRVHVAKKK